jgi:hypothetical protein
MLQTDNIWLINRILSSQKSNNPNKNIPKIIINLDAPTQKLIILNTFVKMIV